MTTTLKSRIDVVDFLRGFAIMAIMFLHNIERFNLYIFPNGYSGISGVNRQVWDTLFFMFAGKTYSIFAILFGFTFFLQFSKQDEKGNDFGPRFLWRLVLLACFATVNAAFFPGEVLMLYAAVGGILFIVRKWSNKAVLALAIFFLIQPVELFYFVRQLADTAWEIPKQINWGMHGAVKDYLSEGTVAALIKGNTTTGQIWSMLWAIENGRFTQTAGLFLIGMLLGRKGWFADLIQYKRTWIKTFVIALVAAATLYIIRENFVLVDGFKYRRSLGVATDMWWKFFGTFVWVSGLVLLYKTNFFRKLTSPFKAYGKMSLTNYVSQSIIGSIIYFPYAFNMSIKLNIVESLLVGAVLFVLQIAFCNWWIKRYKQGPLERLWHKLTWVNFTDQKLKLVKIRVKK